MCFVPVLVLVLRSVLLHMPVLALSKLVAVLLVPVPMLVAVLPPTLLALSYHSTGSLLALY